MTSGLELLGDFIQSCLFIHDGIDGPSTDAGDFLWNEYCSHPIVLGADVCVVDTLNGYGTPCLNHLDEMVGLPNTIIQPKYQQHSLVGNLLGDSQALLQLKQEVHCRELNVSSFYSSNSMNYDSLLQKLSAPHYRPRLFPPQEIFTKANNKVLARSLFEQAKIPIPEGIICHSPKELHDFFRYCQRTGSKGVVLKKFHWDTRFIKSETELNFPYSLPAFPFVVERAYEEQSSTAIHTISWKGRIEPLFEGNQLIHNWRNLGTSLPTKLTCKVQEEMLEYSHTLTRALPHFQGVLNIDYILTDTGEVMAVDLNPRFGSSTYLLYFLQRVGIALDSVHLRYRPIQANVTDLSTLFTDKRFEALDHKKRRGILLIGPTFDFDKGLVTSFFYLLVGANVEELDWLEHGLKQLVARHQIPEERLISKIAV